MRRIAASIVFPVSSPLRSNAVVEIDDNGTLVSVSRGGARFREIAGVEYYSGILVPGLADVMCGPDESGHSLLAGGVRVAGRVGWPGDRDGSYDPPPGQSATPGQSAAPGEPQSQDCPASLPQQMVPGTTGVTWRNRYGGAVSYALYSSMDHFYRFFRESGVSNIFLFSAPEGDLEVLASHGRTGLEKKARGGNGRGGSDRGATGMGRTGMLELMLALQDGPPRYSLPKLLTLATMNGAIASGYRGQAGSLSPGMRPGLNIIEGVDIGKMRLLPVSRIRRID